MAMRKGEIVTIHYADVLLSLYRRETEMNSIFITGKPMLVCGNTAAMVSETRFAEAFTVIGDRSTHYGAFDCSSAKATEEGCCC